MTQCKNICILKNKDVREIYSDVKYIGANLFKFSKSKSNIDRIVLDMSIIDDYFLIGFSSRVISIMSEALDKYCRDFNINNRGLLNKIIISRYIPGDLFVSHTDSSEDSNMVAIILYLNDNFDGGSLIFDDLFIEYIPQSGDIIAFDGSITHSLSKIESGNRYTIMMSSKIC